LQASAENKKGIKFNPLQVALEPLGSLMETTLDLTLGTDLVTEELVTAMGSGTLVASLGVSL